MRRSQVLLGVVMAVAVMVAGLPATEKAAEAAGEILYAYDKLGRLTSVTAPGQGTATYAYDAAGNLKSIARSSSSTSTSSASAKTAEPRVNGVKPNRGRPGELVTIEGSGFGTAPQENQVHIGTLSAQVREARRDRIVAVVPPGATSGDVRVRTSGGASKAKPRFTVIGDAKKEDRADKGDPAPLRAPAGVTALSGRVLRLDGSPLAGVTISIEDVSAQSRSDGRFLLENVEAGTHELVIDGTTAPGPEPYGLFEHGVDVAEGITTVLPWTTWMAALDMANAVEVSSPTTSDVVLRTPRIPGVEVHIPAGTTITDHDWNPLDTVKVSITPLPVDRTPFPLAPRMPIFFTVQPGGAYLSGPGARVVYPNPSGQPPGSPIEFVDHDPEEKGWHVYGTGRVSPDGTQIVPDEGTSLYEFGAFGVTFDPQCNPPDPCPPPGEDSEDGDPVNLSTGLFVWRHTDAVLPDVLPVALTRTYRQRDANVRSFGVGQKDDFSLFIAKDSAGNYSMNLPDGAKIVYAGTGNERRATDTPTEFFGSILRVESLTNYTVTLRSGTVYRFGSHAASLVGISDRFGNTIEITRDWSSGRIERVAAPHGRWLQMTYGVCVTTTGRQCITSVADNTGRTVGYLYDSSGRLIEVTDQAGQKTTYGWAACTGPVTCSQMLTITDPNGVVFLTNTYDPASSRVTSQRQADNTTYTFSYVVDASNRVTRTDVTDPAGIVRQVHFNSSGYATSDVEAVGKPIQATTTITRDPTSHLVTAVVDPAGRRTEATYAATGKPLTITRLAGTTSAVTARFTYEARYDRAASVEDPLLHKTAFTYDDLNQTIRVTDPLGHATLVRLSEGQPVALTNALNHTTYFSYLDGDLVAVADPLGRVATRYVDAGGRVLRETDPSGAVTQYRYDALNRVVGSTNALNGVASLTYDKNGNLLSLTDPLNRVTRWAYDAMDRVTSRTDPSAKTERFTYDALGRIATRTDRNGSIDRYRYDERSRTAFIGFRESGTAYQSSIAYTWNSSDQVTKAVDTAGGTFTLGYDALDRLTSEAGPQGSVTYAYDKAGRRTAMTVAGQPQVTYGYDNADRLISVTQGTNIVSATYDNGDRPVSLALPGGAKETYAYDAASQLTGITYSSGATTLGNLTYTYDNAGRRKSMGGSYARTSLPPAMASATYDANNRLIAMGTTSFTYDAEGQLTSGSGTTYAWNARHELTSLSRTGTTASFAYDPFGRRAGKTINGTTTNFLYDDENVVQENAGATPTANLLTGLGTDEVFTRTDSAGLRSYLTDGLGSTLALANSTGAVLSIYTYDPFGRTTATGSATSNSFQYTGRENDGTGLYYYRARYYDPTQQRFIAEDPLGFDGGDLNLYAYVGNSPTNFNDPSGEIAPIVAACLGGGLFDAALYAGGQWLSGRKVTLGGAAGAFASGCVGGVVGFGLGKLFKAAGALRQACRTNSFTSDTEVLMADGSRTRIADVQIGDMVEAADPQTGERGPRAVTDVIVGEGEKALVDIEIGGHTVTATDKHPFWAEGEGRWLDARDLEGGDRLRSVGGGSTKVDSITKHTSVRRVHNLTVEGLHTYHVVAGEHSILVHNCSLDALSAAGRAADRNGLTRAGRALQKHGDRPGSAFPRATGSAAQKNAAGQNALDDILTTPGSTTTTRNHPLHGTVTEVRAPDGRGARFGPSGNFIGFLEP